MKKGKLLPKQQKIVSILGGNIRLARLRRKLSTEMVAERANISRSTYWSIENGKDGVSIGAIIKVLFVLGLEKDVLQIARDDVFGRKLQDIELVTKKRAPKSK